MEEFNGPVPAGHHNPLPRSYKALKLSFRLLFSLGFFLGVKKCVFIPSQVIVFLGMIVDCVCSFFITEKRRQKFIALGESIVRAESVPLVLIQTFTGMCISMGMAIWAAKLYTSCCNIAISIT